MRLGSIIISLILIWTCSAAAENRTVLVPVDSFPPFQIFPHDGGAPYGEVMSVLQTIVRKIKYLADLEGKTVGTVLGYTYFKGFDKNHHIEKSTARAVELSLKKLDAGRIDVVICPENQWQVLI